MESSFRHTVATGRFTFIAICVMAFFLWFFTGSLSVSAGMGILIVCIITLALHAVYNNIPIIRTQTQLLPSLFLLYCAGTDILRHFDISMVSPLCFLLAQFFLFKSYQTSHPERYVFHAFLFLGTGIVFTAEMSVFVLLFYFVLLIKIQAFTPKSLTASLLGLLVAIELMVGYDLLTNQENIILHRFQDLFVYNPSVITQWVGQKTANMLFLLLFFILSYFHYRKNYYYDKIHIRIFYSILSVFSVFSFALYTLSPQRENSLLLLLLLEVSPFITHYFIFGKGKSADFFFCVFFLYLIVSPFLELWMA